MEQYSSGPDVHAGHDAKLNQSPLPSCISCISRSMWLKKCQRYTTQSDRLCGDVWSMLKAASWTNIIKHCPNCRWLKCLWPNVITIFLLAIDTGSNTVKCTPYTTCSNTQRKQMLHCFKKYYFLKHRCMSVIYNLKHFTERPSNQCPRWGRSGVVSFWAKKTDSISVLV